MSTENSKISNDCVPVYLKYYPWSPLANQLIDLIGFNAAMEFMVEYGGLRIPNPVNSVGSKLSQMIGEEAARKISNALCREELEVPHKKSALALWMKREKHYTQNVSAWKLRCSRTSIKKYLKVDYSVQQSANDAMPIVEQISQNVA